MLSVTDQQEIEVFMKAILGVERLKKYCCEKCGEGNDDYGFFDPHHITYKPCYIVKLCHACHVRVTYLNRCKARMLGRRLTNKDRWSVWREFLQEKTTEEDYKISKCRMKDWFR